jgi:hypothetical protein
MKPVYYKFTWAIPDGAWLYDSNGNCITWMTWERINKLYPGLKDKTYYL